MNCGQQRSEPPNKFSVSECDTIRTVSELGFYFDDIPVDKMKEISVKIGSKPWEVFRPDTQLVDTLRKQRYFLLKREIGLQDTVRVQLVHALKTHKVYGFQYLKMPVNTGHNVVYECKLQELMLDGKPQNGGVVLIKNEDVQ